MYSVVFLLFCYYYYYYYYFGKCIWDFPGVSVVKTWVQFLSLEDFPGKGNGNPLQYSCLGNPIDRGAWQATVYVLTKESDTTQWLNHHHHHHKCHLSDWRNFSPISSLLREFTMSDYWILIKTLIFVDMVYFNDFHIHWICDSM